MTNFSGLAKVNIYSKNEKKNIIINPKREEKER